MAIESGGMFQGYSFSAVDLFAFHAGRLVNLNDKPIMIGDDNEGAVTDPDKTIEVTGKWFLDPADKTALVVDYKIKARGAARAERVVGACREPRSFSPKATFRRKFSKSGAAA